MESKVPPIPRHADVEADPGVLARFNSAVIEEFRANAGVVGGPLENSAVMLLTTTGAKSGQQWMTPVEYFRVDERVIFVGTRGGAEANPDWVHNLRTTPMSTPRLARSLTTPSLVSYPVTSESRCTVKL